MNRFRRDYFATTLWLILAVMFVVSLPWAWARHTVETRNNTVELVMDYDALLDLAWESGVDVAALARRLHEVGVTSLAIPDHSLEQLNELGRLSLLSGEELAGRATLLATGDEAPVRRLWDSGAIKAGNTYVIVENQELVERLEEQFALRLAADEWKLLWDGEQGQWIFELRFGRSTAGRIYTGLDDDAFDVAASAGLYPVPRPINPTYASTEWYQDTIAEWRRLDVHTMIPAGEQAFGYPDNIDATANALKQDGVVLGIIESIMLQGQVNQAGLQAQSQATGHFAARVYSIPIAYLWDRRPDEIVGIWVRAVKERNMRVLYLRPIYTPAGHAPLDVTIDSFKQVATGLKDLGYNLGPASTFEPFEVPKAVQAAITIAVAMAGLIVLNRFFSGSRWWRSVRVPLLVLGVVAGSIYWIIPGQLPVKGTGLMAAIIVPWLAVDTLVRLWARERSRPTGNWVVLAIKTALLTAGISLGGAILMGTLMGSVEYLLEWEYFRGIKLSLVLPLVLGSLSYLSEFGLDEKPNERRNWLQEARDLLNLPLRLQHLVLAGVVLGAVVFYVDRSGNVSRDLIPNSELALRQLLENLLIARPRTKEFLIGYPALVLGAWFAVRYVRGLLYLLFIGVTVGQISLVNSFEHLRTPIALSVLRMVNGLWLGLLLGLIGTALWQWVYDRWLARYGERRGEVRDG